MFFVYSSWYIVLAVLAVAIVALIVTFVMMDKKDRQIIKEFVEKNQANIQEPTDVEKANNKDDQQNMKE
ncbi:MAG TPA: hypothetical protein IAC46_03335 [Candidatus Onthoplasma faecigallinarum]|nr:hypothetical protein [Candidatus Onthoplasma faecigallinarum]